MSVTPNTKYFSLFQTPEENKKLYRTLAKQNHPDKFPGDKEKERVFKEVADEYSAVEKFQKHFGVLETPAPKRREFKYNIKARREARESPNAMQRKGEKEYFDELPSDTVKEWANVVGQVMDLLFKQR